MFKERHFTSNLNHSEFHCGLRDLGQTSVLKVVFPNLTWNVIRHLFKMPNCFSWLILEGKWLSALGQTVHVQPHCCKQIKYINSSLTSTKASVRSLALSITGKWRPATILAFSFPGMIQFYADLSTYIIKSVNTALSNRKHRGVGKHVLVITCRAPSSVYKLTS